MPFVNPKECVIELDLKEGMVVADFGAGSGANTLAAGEMVGNSGTVYAIDIQKELLPAIEKGAEEKKINNIKTIWGDLEEEGGSTLGDGSVDAVIVSNILFQAEDKKNLAKEAYRVLKPGGRILAVDWKASFSNLGPREEDVVNESEAKKLMESVGFEFGKSFPAGDHHYGLVFNK